MWKTKGIESPIFSLLSFYLIWSPLSFFPITPALFGKSLSFPSLSLISPFAVLSLFLSIPLPLALLPVIYLQAGCLFDLLYLSSVGL